MAIYRLGDDLPIVDRDAFVAPNAAVVGKVQLLKGSSVWFGATLRGDNELISVGENSNVQDGSVLHTDQGFPLTIGKNVTIGHMVMLHGCDIGDGSLIGIGSTILNGVKIGKNCLVGAHTLIPEGKVIPDNSMVIGTPGKVVKELTTEQVARRRNVKISPTLCLTEVEIYNVTHVSGSEATTGCRRLRPKFDSL
jgi:carbonic anhydrase/acetyltransferase-like protein (isoleucine patch superfamily)